ncbi:hypothetical protein ROJ8625_01403 [Roseivivax jejudonensis]|uniref:AAA+ family ATPase n=1 Tax=Roseivivax jejudonensis TaxID=1529041 RepID=A0A1X6YTT2_9RHOB|nr:hypothetical protein [Roseivivax jejudonensis]SLN31044.1 hypothetical protein ROJ8625_01403 [Roseivivax jejudonensis]
MKRTFPLLFAAWATAAVPVSGPALAQATEPGSEEDGLSLMERGAELFFRGVIDEMQPALRELRALAEDLGPELRDFVSAMGPALRDLLEEVEDWSAYEAPEILDNGDIIIRRKPDAPPLDTTEPDPQDSIEL